MTNITVSVDEHTHRLARIRAAELDTSVSALVRDFLQSLARGDTATKYGISPEETGRERRRRLLNEAVGEITADGGGLCMAENLSRESLHDRDALR